MTDQPQPRRLAQLQVDAGILRSIFGCTRHNFRIKENPVPRDARLIQVDHDATIDRITLTYESDEFAPVQEGEPIPLLLTSFEMV